MAIDARKNFAASLVATAPSPATSGTSLVVTTGEGALFPTPPFNAVVWPSGVQPTASNAEIVRVTAISTDTLTITRAQEGTSAQSIAVGWNIDQSVTKKMVDDIETAIATAHYDAVVASSGGTHTTLGAALAAASAGWRIYVTDNTTETGAITSSLSNITIEGANAEAVTVALSSYALTLSGTGVTIQNLGFSTTTGSVTLSGARYKVASCHFAIGGNPGANGAINITGADGRFINNTCLQTAAGNTSSPYMRIAATRTTVSSNYFSDEAYQIRDFIETTSAGTYSLISGNKFNSGTNSWWIINSASMYNTIVGNQMFGSSSTTKGFESSTSYQTVTGNTFSFLGYAVSMSSAHNSVISGNFVYIRSGGTGFNGIGNRTAVSGNTFYGDVATNTYGIYGADGLNIAITGNAFHSLNYGIYGTLQYASVVGNSFDSINTLAIDGMYDAVNIQNNYGDDHRPQQLKKTTIYKNVSGGSLATGDALVRQYASANPNEVVKASTAADAKFTGISTLGGSNNNYINVMTEGYCGSVKVDGSGTSIAIGDFLTTSTTAGVMVKATTGQLAFAVACAAATTSTTIAADIVKPTVAP